MCYLSVCGLIVRVTGMPGLKFCYWRVSLGLSGFMPTGIIGRMPYSVVSALPGWRLFQ